MGNNQKVDKETSSFLDINYFYRPFIANTYSSMNMSNLTVTLMVMDLKVGKKSIFPKIMSFFDFRVNFFKIYKRDTDYFDNKCDTLMNLTDKPHYTMFLSAIRKLGNKVVMEADGMVLGSFTHV